MSKDYSYEYEWDNQYCYPNTNVLKNKLKITDAKQLHIAEREITSVRISNAKINPIKGDFDLPHLLSIHHYIFSDIYEWAGKIRWVNIAKGNMFCNFEYVESQADELFKKLRNEKLLENVPTEQFPSKLSYYLSELNVIHPFREGNGRAQRLFIEYLAENNGYSVDFSLVSERDMIEASALAFGMDYSKMDLLFKRITKPISEQPIMTQTFL